MAPFAKLSTIALMIASGAVAAPWDHTTRQATHSKFAVGPRKVEFQSYHPPSTFETYGTGIDHPLTKRGVENADPAEAAKAFLETKLGNGIAVANAVANVALKNNKVVSYGASFVKPKSVASTTPTLTKEEAIAKAEAATDAKYNDWPTTLEACAAIPQNEETGEWYEAYVDASNGEIVNMINFVHKASYRVVPFTSQDPEDGFTTVTDPHDTVASPNGWHQYGTTTTTSTSGNNVLAYKGSTTATTSQSSAGNNYDYTLDSTAAPATSIDAARVNAFYVANMIHDLTYRYGFDEASYNFQQDNNGKGGAQNDRVQISVQDTAYTNNADFSTPPDGQSGKMRMFVWTYTNPRRDGAFENDIVTHEYGHGISNRLTGGGTARCLTTQQSWGLGEGWSDALADWTEQTSEAKALSDFTMGEYVTKIAGGIRSYPYSTSKSVNPLTYASLASLGNEEHAVGEVWALIWHEIYASLINKLGFSTNKNESTGTAGNIVALHLFIDSLKLQPCNPTFITARDAIIQADANRYGGANKCALWAAFAKRGLGSISTKGATETRRDSTTLPSGC
ncbi:Fungalysin metallopeptidase (M36) [Rhizoctonia solani]|uniref:Extracellular metalloproteinase n=1 Tax=Rhizoctonia solani TaxID=456999 RepID=A0A8H7M2B0_9AGAM|nr:Fungalysin metallopeptidase (M36) [Rhizoctonia solani]